MNSYALSKYIVEQQVIALYEIICDQIIIIIIYMAEFIAENNWKGAQKEHRNYLSRLINDINFTKIRVLSLNY